MNINYVAVSDVMERKSIEGEIFCLENCTNCDSTTSFCEILNRLPVCQCKNGYVKVANGYENERHALLLVKI